MVLYYAMGGGLGHLTRMLAVCHTLRLDAPVVVITASSFASTLPARFTCLAPPAAGATNVDMLSRWLQSTIDRLQPTLMFIDTFPAGIRGEFAGVTLPSKTRVHHVARRLRWPVYEPYAAVPAPQADAIWLVEPIEDAHRTFLGSAPVCRSLPLVDPPPTAPERLAEAVPALAKQRPFWLVIHSGDADECQSLIDFAADMKRAEACDTTIVVATPHPVPGLETGRQVHHFPVYPLFPYADRIVSAAGFNMIRQAEPYPERHRFMPFARRFDDQFYRLARWRERHAC